MVRGRKRKFAEGGPVGAEDEIIVKGKRPAAIIDPSQFDLSRFGGMGGMASGPAMTPGVVGGGSGSQRLSPLTPPPAAVRSRMSMTPAVLRQPAPPVGKLTGDRGATAYGGRFRMGFAEGGKAKAKPVKKMAKGGSTASKRGDGCCSKGKTKGKFV
jgi:hypothetical protein